jgi:16S rRNA (adenine1518-N6/adenine1519-N6)-dimethyltransferase
MLMLQQELTRRLSASPSTKEYGALTLQIQLHYHVEYLRSVPASVFIPQPEVDSAIVRVTPRDPKELPPCDNELFKDLVRHGFSQRRKQLGGLLRKHIPDWPHAADSLGLDRQTRAEALSLEQWIDLTNHVQPIPVPDRTGMGQECFPVVDQKDCLLSNAPRSKVHGDNLLHRAVHILVFNRAGEVFLQKRSRWKDRHPLLWDSSAAGHVNAGEEYDAAATRELEEELGIKVALQKVVKLPASEGTGQEFIWLYRAEHSGAFKLDRGEIETGGFFPPTIVSKWIAARPKDFAPGFVECWKAYTTQKDA